MHPHTTMSSWTIDTVMRQRGGRVIVLRQHAPLARALPYRRAAGELPSSTSGADVIGRLGWSVVLGERGLGDVLLALGLVQALAEGTGRDSELHYQGPRPRLMQRCRLGRPLSSSPVRPASRAVARLAWLVSSIPVSSTVADVSNHHVA